MKSARPRTPKQPTRSSPRPISVGWVTAAANVIENLESPRFPALLVDALKAIADFEYCMVVLYRGASRPVNLFDTLPNPGAAQGLVNYLNSTYVLNPFYRTYRSGIAEGVYRMRDLAPEGFFGDSTLANAKAIASSAEEIGYLTEGWPAGREEVCVALTLPGGECAELSLSRISPSNGFSASDVKDIATVVPFLGAAFRHYWLHYGARTSAEPRNTDAEDAFQKFGGKLLSPRERQLAQLLLLGHSTISAGLQLGISPTTVKSHRKNLYAKLGIGSQFELFSMFRDSLGAPPPS